MINKVEKNGEVTNYSPGIKIRQTDKVFFTCKRCGTEAKKEYRRWDCENDVYFLDK